MLKSWIDGPILESCSRIRSKVDDLSIRLTKYSKAIVKQLWAIRSDPMAKKEPESVQITNIDRQGDSLE